MHTSTMPIPPCYNYTFFYGVGSLIFNDEMGELLATRLEASKLKHPMLDAVVKDLKGEEPDHEMQQENASCASYDYGHFLDKGMLTFNRPMAILLSEGIKETTLFIPRPLWALHFKLAEFEDIPQNTSKFQRTREFHRSAV